jgi:hypothetical protein
VGEGIEEWARMYVLHVDVDGSLETFTVPRWARINDIEEIEQALVTLKADLMSELIGVRVLFE